MFGKEIYVGRRKRLLEEMRATGNDGRRGIAVFLGNVEAPQNYRGNDYKTIAEMTTNSDRRVRSCISGG